MKRLLILTLMTGFSCLLNAQTGRVLCEDTCRHLHGIDLSHYQGDVFWEAVGENDRNLYVYLKATEGGDNIDFSLEY